MFGGTLQTVLIVAFVCFMLYRRVRSQIGRQEVRPKGLMLFVVLFASAALVLLAMPGATALRFEAAGGGLAIGLGLAWLGLQKTRFETTAEGHFYTSNPWITLGVTGLFISRVVSRFATFLPIERAAQAAEPASTNPFMVMQQNPLTLGVFFLLAGYYVAYYTGILRASRAPQPVPEES